MLPGSPATEVVAQEPVAVINLLQEVFALVAESADPNEFGGTLLPTSETDEPDPRI
jgi:hypothetical protein